MPFTSIPIFLSWESKLLDVYWFTCQAARVAAPPGAERVRGAAGILQQRESDMATKQVSCDCGKIFREETDSKLVVTVQQHAREVHDMDLTREQVLAMAEPV